MKESGKSRLAILIITILYAGLRLTNIDSLVTTDEPFWLGRSANFYRALVDGDFNNTYQMAHPGVMTMWAGALAYLVTFAEYAELAPGNLEDPYNIEIVLREAGRDPMAMMVAAKISKILVQAVFFVIALTYLRKIAGVAITVVTGLLMAFAPFMSGFDSALHVDGLFTTICFAAILAICWAAFDQAPRRTAWQSMWPWLAAGSLSGMAVLTRATGLVLVGVIGLAMLIQVIAMMRAEKPLLTAVGATIWRGLLCVVAAALTTFALMPALWVAPLTTMEKLWSWSSMAATEGHENPTFYRGIHVGNPGYEVYLEVLAWRSSPVEWLGVILLAVLIVWAWKRRDTLTTPLAKTLLVMLVFAGVYLVAMSVGAKKFDRYILPVFPAITLFAGVGIGLAMDWIRLLPIRRASLLATSMAGLLIIGQAASWAGSQPYRLDYYNPILGGAERAQNILQMGWGQGGDDVVGHLQEYESEGWTIVQTTAVPSAFTYFLPDDSSLFFRQAGIGTPAGWYDTDFFVAGIQQTQRNLIPAYSLLAHAEPIHTVEVNGVTYFEIFDMRDLPVPSVHFAPTACSFEFGDEVTLMQILPRDRSIDFYFVSDADVSGTQITLSIDIVLSNGEEVREDASFTPAAPGVISRVSINLPTDTVDVPLHEAEITIVATNESGTMPVTAPWLTNPVDSAATSSSCYEHTVPGYP